MPETPARSDASGTPEKRDIYGLYDASHTADAADMYEEVYEAPEHFADFADFADAAETDETPEILSRVDSLMMRRRSPTPPALPTEHAPTPEPEITQDTQEDTPEAAAEAAPEPRLEPTLEALPEPASAPTREPALLTEPVEPTESIEPAETPEAENPEADIPTLSALPEKPAADDDDLPVLTDVIPTEAEARPAEAFDAPDEEAFGEPSDEIPAEYAAPYIAEFPMLSVHAGNDDAPTTAMSSVTPELAADITRLCKERLAGELPALLETLLSTAERELRAGIAGIIDSALQEALAPHTYPTLTSDTPEISETSGMPDGSETPEERT